LVGNRHRLFLQMPHWNRQCLFPTIPRLGLGDSQIFTPILAILVESTTRPNVTAEEFGKITKTKATVVKIPGDHSSLWESPYVEKLAEAILNNM